MIFDRSHTRRWQRRSIGAFTIIEMIVTIAGMVVVSGIAYRLFDETQKASLKMIRRQSAIDYAALAMDQISKILYEAVSPSDLDAAMKTEPEFLADRISIPSFRGAAEKGLYLVSIESAIGPEGMRFYQIRETPVGDDFESSENQEVVSRIGDSDVEFEPVISFRYAVDGSARYTPALPSGGWPALIEISLRIELEENDENPVKLQTSVIPGWIASDEELVAPGDQVNPPEPTPTPVSVPTPISIPVEDATTTRTQRAASPTSSPPRSTVLSPLTADNKTTGGGPGGGGAR